MLQAIKKACKNAKVSKMGVNEWLIRLPEKEHITPIYWANSFTLSVIGTVFTVKYHVCRECRRNGRPSISSKAKTQNFDSFDQAIGFINEYKS